MTSMRERMARALAAKAAEMDIAEGIAWEIDFPHGRDADWQDWLPYVGALLDVLAEPSEGVVEAAYRKQEHVMGPAPYCHLNFSVAFAEMIRAIKEGA